MIFLAPAARAQATGATPSGKISVYFDCRTFCDFDLIREEASYVDWVRDRSVADVHLLVTSESGGAGGSTYTLAFIGLRDLAGRGDTLTFTTDPTMTDDETRRRLVRGVGMGLMPYVARRGGIDRVRITAVKEGAAAAQPANPAHDPWHAWVFDLGVSGGVNGQRTYTSRRVDGSFQARRVTEQWRIRYDASYDYGEDRFLVEETDSVGNVLSSETFANIQRSWDMDGLLVRSAGPHLSLGVRTNLRSNVYDNLRHALYVAPALEYNVFPYTESTRREFTFEYGIGVQANSYAEMTIYDKLNETLPLHYVRVNYRAREPWGSMNASMEHRNYLNDASKRNTGIYGGASIRLFRGVNVNMNANYNWIRDQIYLVKGETDQADVLLRRRALSTSFRYGMRMGLNYTFGSIFNNVVNTRF